MMAQLEPNLKYDHVFAIVRLDTFEGLDVSPEDSIIVKKIVLTQETAESEVIRLNRLNKDKRCKYFWQVTRFEREES